MRGYNSPSALLQSNDFISHIAIGNETWVLYMNLETKKLVDGTGPHYLAVKTSKVPANIFCKEIHGYSLLRQKMCTPGGFYGIRPYYKLFSLL